MDNKIAESFQVKIGEDVTIKIGNSSPCLQFLPI